MSFTQYTPGALFRYVDNGFRVERVFKQEDPRGYEKMVSEKSGKWAEGLKLWMTMEELLEGAFDGSKKQSNAAN